MTEGTSVVAADTNIIRQFTPRRYLTVLEGLRERDVAVLPLVHDELQKQLRTHAAAYIQALCHDRGLLPEQIDRAAIAAGRAATGWLGDEVLRNDSAYRFIADLGLAHYEAPVMSLPADAFTDSNDKWIYAQAWAHDIDVLSSRNRSTINGDVLQEHFAARDWLAPPVRVRGLYEHTARLAEEEGRPLAEISFEAMLAAVIPEDWTPAKGAGVATSCGLFLKNLRLAEGRHPGGALAAQENELVRLMDVQMKRILRTEKTFLAHCAAAHAARPQAARNTEMRYHERVRAAVRETGLDPWSG